MTIISITNEKGGVGKTTTALNIGAGLAKVGKRVLLIDSDQQQTLSRWLGFSPDNKPTLCDFRKSMAFKLANIKILLEGMSMKKLITFLLLKNWQVSLPF